jgi:Pumilio-family RNA binding repeat
VDLAEPAFTEPLCLSFRGKIPALSKQKFSSNVMEKCIRVADTNTKRTMIEEMVNPNELEKMLRDSFANYVVQTAMEYADPEMKIRLVESIRPLLPAIRQTPHGRRIQGKILGSEGQGRLSGFSSGHITPNDPSAPGQFPIGRQLSFGINPVNSRFQASPFDGNNVGSYLGQGFSLPGMEGSHFAPHLQSNAPANHSDASTAIFSPAIQTSQTQQNSFLGYEHPHQAQPYSYF